MSRSIYSPPPCECCGAEYRNTGCVRGYRCQCTNSGFINAPTCEVCKYCSKHCHCTDEMKGERVAAYGDYLERLRVIRSKHPEQINKRVALF